MKVALNWVAEGMMGLYNFEIKTLFEIFAKTCLVMNK